MVFTKWLLVCVLFFGFVYLIYSWGYSDGYEDGFEEGEINDL